MTTIKTESTMKRVRKQLIATFEFTSNNKYTVSVYENRIEIEQGGVLNFINKGSVGTIVFYLKRLGGLEFKQQGKTTGYIEFLGTGFKHEKSTFDKVKKDNIILFNHKEAEKAQELFDLINDLID